MVLKSNQKDHVIDRIESGAEIEKAEQRDKAYRCIITCSNSFLEFFKDKIKLIPEFGPTNSPVPFLFHHLQS